MKKHFNIWIVLLIGITMAACSGNKSKEAQDDQSSPVVSVKIVYPTDGNISNYITVNGKTIYLKKNAIIAPFSGYITRVFIHLGDRVRNVQPLFILETKENQALASSPGLTSNAGRIKIASPVAGFISDLAVSAPGTYVTEGTVLGNVVQNRQTTIQMNVPFEYHNLIRLNELCSIQLPDGTNAQGLISNILPTIDPVSQTQTVFVKPLTNEPLPENLNVIIRFIDLQHHHTLLLPKSAIQTNETQDHFWVMKVVHDTLAIKVPVIKGIENDSTIEILNPVISPSDPIITDGGYGLTDSTTVKIVR
ncbi:efflux RND transporter periplasmic adaptor subunit [Microbacter margulisiae]|uniref:Multidrug efflux pump subunit AcrA (Membrane-fusion protein) n=1 Tax=Microbacter margulisiae TaxID=1350067 RepID=A0A7W5H1G8_9PORP|nr:HlyD family efflux transporter periplasmic adaptor subunit [Microbacter margulisiae]MBB3187578.1 multidrug efflux pump subunit AcrA (membrane-fusion protein) [Microbacter margulisiae]